MGSQNISYQSINFQIIESQDAKIQKQIPMSNIGELAGQEDMWCPYSVTKIILVSGRRFWFMIILKVI